MAGPTLTNRWKLGLFVTLGLALTLAVVGWIGAERMRRETIEIHYFFDEEVSGLDLGAPVQFRGVRIGKVSMIRAAPDRRHVEVVADIYVDALADLGLSVGDALGEGRDAERAELEPFMPDELRAQLRSSLLTGVTFIQTDFFDSGRYPERRYPFEVPWNTVHTAPSAYKSIEAGLLEMTSRVPELTEEARATLRSLRREIEGSEVSGAAAEARRMAKNLADRLEEVERMELLARTRGALDAGARALGEVEQLAAELRGERGHLAAVAGPWREAGEVLAEVLVDSDLPATFRLVRELTLEMGRTSIEFAALAHDARRELEVLRGTLDAVRRLADLLERDPGALLHGRTPTSPLSEVR